MPAIYGPPPQYKASQIPRPPPFFRGRFAYQAGIMNGNGQLCINGQVIPTIPDSELEAKYPVFCGNRAPASGYV